MISRWGSCLVGGVSGAAMVVFGGLVLAAFEGFMLYKIFSFKLAGSR